LCGRLSEYHLLAGVLGIDLAHTHESTVDKQFERIHENDLKSFHLPVACKTLARGDMQGVAGE
jgi:hypothetical protein